MCLGKLDKVKSGNVMPSRDLQWQGLVDAVSEGLVLLDGDDAMVDVNDAFAELVGRSRSQILETPDAPWWDQGSLAAGCAAARPVARRASRSP